MNGKYKICNNFADDEKGSVLLIAVLILVVLTVIGISAITTSTIEIQIAGNEMLYKTNFYAADGGTEVGRELIEQNLACPNGFQAEPLTIGQAIVADKEFAKQENAPGVTYPSDPEPSDAVDGILEKDRRDIHFPIYTPPDDSRPHTNIVAFGNTQLSTGNALQMAAGYEGKGKGAAGGGGKIIYNLYSQHKGWRGSKASIMIHYRHMIGQEGECNY